MSRFNRTLSGKIAKYLFYKEPLIWVEGVSDIPFYSNLVSGINCHIEAADGREDCQNLIEALIDNNLPYLVVIDGHYEMLTRVRSRHRRVVLLQRHSIENYLFEQQIINIVACQYSSIEPPRDISSVIITKLEQHLEKELHKLLVLDIALVDASPGQTVFPDSHLPIHDTRNPVQLSRHRIIDLQKSYGGLVSQEEIDSAESMLENYLKQHRFVDVLKGHFVFGIIRDLFVNIVTDTTGNSPNIDNRGLLLILSGAVWAMKPHKDHESLYRRLRRALRESQYLRMS